MNFDIPTELADYLIELDAFIDAEIKPLEQQDDNIRFFDHRREDARTDWERGGLPNEEWEALLVEAKRLADEAGHYRYPLSEEYGGKNGTNLGMAIIREHANSLPEVVLERLRAAVLEFARDTLAADDQTAILIRCR